MKKSGNNLLIDFVKLFFILVLLYSCGCTDRDRSNPLDPKNRKTSGQPTGLRAYSGYQSVTLAWDDFGNVMITTIRIYRKISDQAQFDLIAEIDGQARSYVDRNLKFGITYTYQISVTGENYVSPPSVPVIITLGPSYIWVADYGAGELVRFPYDLNQADFRFGYFLSPVLVQVIPGKSEVWLADRFDRAIYRISAEPRILAKSGVLNQVSNMTMSLNSLEVWVIESGNRYISKLDAEGKQVFKYGPFDYPYGIAAAGDGFSVWVTDLKRKSVYWVSSMDSSAHQLPGIYEAPRDLVYHASSGQLWIADSTRIVLFDTRSNDVSAIFKDFHYAVELAVDVKREVCWILEYGQNSDPGTVIQFSATRGRLSVATGLISPIALAVDEYDGRCYVVDAGSRQVLAISPEGRIEQRIKTLVNPSDVAIETNEY